MRRKNMRKRKWRWFWGSIGVLVLASLLPFLVLRFVDPPTSAFMLARQWQARGQADFSLQYQWVDLERISPNLLIALVAAEDQGFPGITVLTLMPSPKSWINASKGVPCAAPAPSASRW